MQFWLLQKRKPTCKYALRSDVRSHAFSGLTRQIKSVNKPLSQLQFGFLFSSRVRSLTFGIRVTSSSFVSLSANNVISNPVREFHCRIKSENADDSDKRRIPIIVKFWCFSS